MYAYFMMTFDDCNCSEGVWAPYVYCWQYFGYVVLGYKL